VSTIRVLISRLKGLFAGKQKDEDLNEELQAHLEMLVDENRRKGMPEDEARRAARVHFGGIAQTAEAYREGRGLHFVQTFLQDLRYAFRMLRRAPGFAAVVVISLALGIGANTAIFSAIDAVMLRMLPVEDPQQLVMLHWHAPRHPQKYLSDLEGSGFGNAQEGITSYSFAYAQYQQFKNENHVFSSTFAFAANNDSVNIGIDGRAETTVMQGVSGNYFEGLGVQTILGRPITPEDDQESAPATAVVSYEFWRGRLGASPDVVGKKIVVNALPVTILGVAQPEFFGLEPGNSPGLYVPLAMYSAEQTRQGGTDSSLTYLKDPKVWWAGVVGRLKPGATATQAEAELKVIFDQGLNAAVPVPDVNKPTLLVKPVNQGLNGLRRQFSSSLFLLMMMVGAVLLIACGNVAALLLTRASARQREIAVRLSLGARRARLIRQLLTESVLLACCGGILGLVIAKWAGRVLLTLLSGGNRINLELHLDARVLLFTAVICIVSGILFGLAPALRATCTDLLTALKQPSSGASGGKITAGKILVGGQVAMCLLLLVSAGLLLRTLNRLQTVDLGFNRQNVLLFSLRPGLNGYKGMQLDAFYLEVQRRIQRLPGVDSVAFSDRNAIGAGTSSTSAVVPGYGENDDVAEFHRHIVGPGYFATLGIPIRLGRALGLQDAHGAPLAVVVNQRFVDKYMHGGNPLGHEIVFTGKKPSARFQIVGVAGDVKYNRIREDVPPTVYLPHTQIFSAVGGSRTEEFSWPFMTFAIKSAAAGQPWLLAGIRHELTTLDKNVPMVEIRTETQVVAHVLSLERTFATLSSAFGFLALLLACVGLYGTMAYAVARKTNEIGIRMALGAERGTILAMVLRETAAIVVAGIVVGVPAAWIASSLLKTRLFGLTPHDPWSIGLSVAATLLVTMIAGYIPARRASRVDPMVALRYE
jgi:predicted permease